MCTKHTSNISGKRCAFTLRTLNGTMVANDRKHTQNDFFLSFVKNVNETSFKRKNGNDAQNERI